MLEIIQNLKTNETCYPRGRADVTVSKTGSDEFPFHLLDGHGYDYWFDTAEHCAMWMEGDRAELHENVHYICPEDDEEEDEIDIEYISLCDSRFPFITSMHDPCDPGHTRGIPDYFIEQINEAIKDGGDKDALEAEKALILSLNCDRIVVGEEDEDE